MTSFREVSWCSSYATVAADASAADARQLFLLSLLLSLLMRNGRVLAGDATDRTVVLAERHFSTREGGVELLGAVSGIRDFGISANAPEVFSRIVYH